MPDSAHETLTVLPLSYPSIVGTKKQQALIKGNPQIRDVLFVRSLIE